MGLPLLKIPVYISCVRELLNQASYEDYCKKLKQAEINWSQAFHQYYMNVLLVSESEEEEDEGVCAYTCQQCLSVKEEIHFKTVICTLWFCG